MDQILATFGIDWRLLLINAINFALALGVLWYFLYTPIMRILEERLEKVAQGVRDADEAKRRKEELERSRSEILAKAGKEADETVAHAHAQAAAKEREILAAGEAAAGRTLQDAQVQAEELKSQAIAGAREEVAKLVVLGIEKTLSAQGRSALGGAHKHK